MKPVLVWTSARGRTIVTLYLHADAALTYRAEDRGQGFAGGCLGQDSEHARAAFETRVLRGEFGRLEPRRV